MVTQHRSPTQYLIDANGDPVSGGEKFFYAEGTLNLLSVFQDEALTIGQTNPVVADTAGMLPPIWLAETRYKTITKTSGGTVIETIDPVVSGDTTFNAPTTIASATTTDLSAAAGVNVTVTGTNTITGLGTSPNGIHRYLLFTASLILTHNALSLILPGGVNITTAAGDTIIMKSEGSGNWRCIGWSGADGVSLITNIVEDITPQFGAPVDSNSHTFFQSQGADIASATALTLGTDGNSFDVTGTTTITSINAWGTANGVVILQFDGILTIEHDATSLVLPRGANITTQVGDIAEFYEYAPGDYRCKSYFRADGTALFGGAFSEPFVSAELTITTDSTLTLPHGLGVRPVLIQGWLFCQTDDIGYVAGEEIPIAVNVGIDGKGTAMVPDATNMNLIYADSVSVFNYLHKTNRTTSNMLNSSWTLVIYAWA